MAEEHWEEIGEAAGDLQAEILRGLLEAQGIRVFLSKEGGGHVYALTVGKLGTVHILVPSSQSQAAQTVLQDYYAGKFEDMGLADETGPAKPTELTPGESDASDPGDDAGR